MFFRFVLESMRRAPRRKLMTVAAVAMGTAVATAVLGVELDIGDKMNVELRGLGANILVTPRARTVPVESSGVQAVPVGADDFIPEAQIPKIKTIFWQLNITGFAPSLSGVTSVSALNVPVRGVWFDRPYRTPDGRDLRTGVRAVNPSWNIDGRWPRDDQADDQGGCLPGAAIAAKLHLQPGSRVSLFNQPFTVTGIIRTGSEEDDQILVRLADLQRLLGRTGQVDSIQVAALTKPEDDFAHKDPARMSPAERERWDCTNYVTTIARQIERVLPMAVARPIRRVADSEGKVLSKISGLMLLIALAALAAAALTVWSVMATTMLERRGEIAIMQATGASDRLIASLFAAEVALEGLAGGAVGVLAGLQMAHWVGRSVFRTGIEIPAILPPLAMAIAILVAIAGAFPPIRRSLALPPAIALRERA
jgi:putative ABC transport system permease protein